jgi:nucleotide-binding universal stress UspA family protein
MISTPHIKTVLIPVDGSVHARKAALVGAAIAAKFGARVVLLHVLLRNLPLEKVYDVARSQNMASDVLERFKPDAPPIYDFGLTVPAGVINPIAPTELLVEIGQRILDTEKRAIEGQGVKQVDLLIDDDDVADKILEVAKKESADFIVLGRRGLGALEGMLSGSVSNKVSHLAPATVVSVT